jgi:hypothetical protein
MRRRSWTGLHTRTVRHLLEVEVLSSAMINSMSRSARRHDRTPVSVGDLAASLSPGDSWSRQVCPPQPRTRIERLPEHPFFAETALDTVEPDTSDIAGFDAFIQRFKEIMPVERAAADHT